MTFNQRFCLPDVSDFVFNMGNGFKYALGDQGRCQKTHHGEDKCNNVSAMCADQL